MSWAELLSPVPNLEKHLQPLVSQGTHTQPLYTISSLMQRIHIFPEQVTSAGMLRQATPASVLRMTQRTRVTLLGGVVLESAGWKRPW